MLRAAQGDLELTISRATFAAEVEAQLSGGKGKGGGAKGGAKGKGAKGGKGGGAADESENGSYADEGHAALREELRRLRLENKKLREEKTVAFFPSIIPIYI